MILLKDFILNNDGKEVLNIPSQEFKAKSWIEIIGKNNSGKSIFLNTLHGINITYSGQIIYNGELLTKQNLQKIRTAIGFFSNSLPLLQDKTLRANISIALSVHGSSIDLDKEEFLAFSLKEFNLDTKLLVPIYKLSESDQCKVRIIRSICHIPKILLLDCPFRIFDQDSRKDLMTVLIRFFQKNDCLIIMASDEPSPFQGSDRSVFLLDQAQLKSIK